jgi:hypothetical protein
VDDAAMRKDISVRRDALLSRKRLALETRQAGYPYRCVTVAFVNCTWLRHLCALWKQCYQGS